MKRKTRADFGKKVSGPRTHANCYEQTNVQRPGKTAHERYLRASKG